MNALQNFPIPKPYFDETNIDGMTIINRISGTILINLLKTFLIFWKNENAKRN